MMPFVNLVLNEPSRNSSWGELSIRKNDLAFSVLLALAFCDIVLAGQAFTDKMSYKATEYAY
jgi:hypothetical protein